MRIVEEENIRFIRLQFTDIFGSFKNIAITTSQLEKALGNKCMFDGSSIEGFVRIEESDMYLYPDLDSFVVFPWYGEGERAARLICDVYKPDGTPFEGDPRGLLKKVLRQAEEMGFSGFNVGPECEFFLFNYDEDGHPTTKSFDRGAYFELGPTDLGESARRDMCLTLEDMGFEIEASHHECANGQHEIDFKYDDALSAADNIVTFKLVVKTVAHMHNMYATFMPKPVYGKAGSGMHVNMSLMKAKTRFTTRPMPWDSAKRPTVSLRAYSSMPGGCARSPIRWSIRISAWYRAMKHRCTSPGRRATAAR